MFIQVKNTQRKSTLRAASGNYVAFNSVPTFCLLLDFVLNTGSVSSYQVNVPHAYAVYASGATARAFKVLNQKLELARVFGGLLSENARRPYMAGSVT